jgi:hypothetical protein
VHLADEVRGERSVDLLRRHLLEETRLEGRGVVDEHVDALEPLDGGPHRRLGIGAAGDVELDDQEVVRPTHGPGHRVGVPAGGRHRVAGGEGGLGEVDAHATTGAGDEPDLAHFSSLAPSRGGATSTRDS